GGTRIEIGIVIEPSLGPERPPSAGSVAVRSRQPALDAVLDLLRLPVGGRGDVLLYVVGESAEEQREEEDGKGGAPGAQAAGLQGRELAGPGEEGEGHESAHQAGDREDEGEHAGGEILEVGEDDAQRLVILDEIVREVLQLDDGIDD